MKDLEPIEKYISGIVKSIQQRIAMTQEDEMRKEATARTFAPTMLGILRETLQLGDSVKNDFIFLRPDWLKYMLGKLGVVEGAVRKWEKELVGMGVLFIDKSKNPFTMQWQRDGILKLLDQANRAGQIQVIKEVVISQ
jgi:hypothetical protein